MDKTRVDGEFLALLNQYRGAIERVSRMYTSSAIEREELVQEVVYQLWRAFPSCRNESAPLTWVYRIAINTAVTGLRRRARQPAHVPLDAAVSVQSPPTSTTSDSRMELLYRVIRRLGPVDSRTDHVLPRRPELQRNRCCARPLGDQCRRTPQQDENQAARARKEHGAVRWTLS